MKNVFRTLLYSFAAISALVFAQSASARLEVCNQTDLTLLVTVGYDTQEGKKATEGWWKIYPGFCEVPVDVAMLKGSYYVHAESNPRSTMPVDEFGFGDDIALCVQANDFRIPDNAACPQGSVLVNYKELDKNWRNNNVVNIIHKKRRYKNLTRAKVAGAQRMLSILGYPMDEIDGMPGRQTIEALDQVGRANRVFGFNFADMFIVLETLIAQKQKLDN